MNFKFNLSARSIFKIIYLTILVVNLVFIIIVYNFIKNFVYGSVFVDQNFLQSQKIKSGNDLDINKFDAVVSEIEKRQQRNAGELNIKNPF